MTKKEKKYYVMVFNTLITQYKLTDVQAIDAMALSMEEYDAILDGIL